MEGTMASQLAFFFHHPSVGMNALIFLMTMRDPHSVFPPKQTLKRAFFFLILGAAKVFYQVKMGSTLFPPLFFHCSLSVA